MSQDIRIPEVSEGITTGKVIGVSVSVGDRVEADQTLLEMETDKAVVAVPSPFTGKITEIKVDEGDDVEVGQVVMSGEPEGAEAPAEEKEEDREKEKEPEPEEPQPEEAEPEEPAAKEAEEEPAEAREEPPEEEAPAKPREERREEKPREEKREEPAAKEKPAAPRAELPPPRTEATPPDQVAPASPIVRRFAHELGVDIHAVTGTGPGGRIGEQDVRDFVKRTMERQEAGAIAGGAVARPLPDFTRWGEVERQPLTQVRKITAEAMSYAWSVSPHVTQDDRADVTAVESFREEYNRKRDQADKLTMTAILVKVAARALRVFPQLNSSLDVAAQELILKDYVHIGVAVDTEGGLLVPVIRDADRKGLATLATELNETAAKTRERRVSPADMEGGTFTISNLGGIGGTAFTPIVYTPQVAILGVSRAEMEPVWDGREFQPRLRLPLSLSYDHRVVDGADGARFLRWICAALEQPLLLAMEDLA